MGVKGSRGKRVKVKMEEESGYGEVEDIEEVEGVEEEEVEDMDS